MIEVFKTSVSDVYYAKLLLHKIHKKFPAYKANFDLNDCDRILRIQSPSVVEEAEIIKIVAGFGYEAELLRDEIVVPGIEN